MAVFLSPLDTTREEVLAQFRAVRAQTMELVAPLEIEDYVVQPAPDASPTKWHLAHTTWFFETFVLSQFQPSFTSAFPGFDVLFNSYYNAVGAQWNRADRGKLARPTVSQTLAYRAAIDEGIEAILQSASDAQFRQFFNTLRLGLHHEQQHQELLLCDLKSLFALNPLVPIYRERKTAPPCMAPLSWRFHEGGLQEVGYGGQGFCFDNETPRHRVWLEPFVLSSRLVTCGEWLEFIADGGYERAELWLSAGWDFIVKHKVTAPLYWEFSDEGLQIRTLAGRRAVEAHEPVSHISYFEAEAFARWSEARLPSESEWEIGARDEYVEGNFLESGFLHPIAPSSEFEPFGNLWQWTRSQYSPYPGFEPDTGALGEYNGKWMCNQFVLRGGSCASPRSHLRATYRNFFASHTRSQFSGLRLARDA